MSAALPWRRLAGGAVSALAVDASAAALALAEQGAAASGFGDRFTTRKGDAFDVMEALGAEGQVYDLVICDPPAFAPAKPALEAGLRAYERLARLAAPLVAPGGYLVLCSCSHAADLQAFRNAIGPGDRARRAAGAAHAHRVCRAGPSDAAATGGKRLSEGAVLPAGRLMKAVLDACVIFPTVLREILLGVAAKGLYQPLWSERILREWVLATAQVRPRGTGRGRGEAALMRAAFPRAMVREQADIETRLLLPDLNDHHVLAVAIAAHADCIVTFNAKDFPRHVLAEEGIARRDPDGLLWELWSHHPETLAGLCVRFMQRPSGWRARACL